MPTWSRRIVNFQKYDQKVLASQNYPNSKEETGQPDSETLHPRTQNDNQTIHKELCCVHGNHKAISYCHRDHFL